MGDAVEGDAMNERCLPTLVHKFCRDPWVTARVVPQPGPEEYTLKAAAEDVQHGEDAIKSSKQHAVRKMRETVGQVDVIFEGGALRNRSNMQLWNERSARLKAWRGHWSMRARNIPHSEDLCN